ncbi:LeuD/DmdB family oxidoreductase small subunit [Aminipila sp.]|uniref:LeuD/DmdB family oxidoreductase small subunit n=1 Tax=Aminipila sp. TaxID=2060095 RepID=UPI002898B1AC|nr:3-isopropylmalate dehydratase small subunit [Aminipila sp.]
MKIWCFGNYVDTDAILPAKYLNNNDPEFYSKHCLEQLNIDFAKEVKKGDIVLGGEFFGYGSSRESAPYAIKYLGVEAIFARSFSRIFFRNSINIGLPVIDVNQEEYEFLSGADNVWFSRDYETVHAANQGSTLLIKTKFPVFIKEILAHGGLLKSYGGMSI